MGTYVVVFLEYDYRNDELRTDIQTLIYTAYSDALYLMERIDWRDDSGNFRPLNSENSQDVSIFMALRRLATCAPCQCDYKRFEPIFDKYDVRTHKHKNFEECMAASVVCYCAEYLDLTVDALPCTDEIAVLGSLGYELLVKALVTDAP